MGHNDYEIGGPNMANPAKDMNELLKHKVLSAPIVEKKEKKEEKETKEAELTSDDIFRFAKELYSASQKRKRTAKDKVIADGEWNKIVTDILSKDSEKRKKLDRMVNPVKQFSFEDLVRICYFMEGSSIRHDELLDAIAERFSVFADNHNSKKALIKSSDPISDLDNILQFFVTQRMDDERIIQKCFQLSTQILRQKMPSLTVETTIKLGNLAWCLGSLSHFISLDSYKADIEAFLIELSKNLLKLPHIEDPKEFAHFKNQIKHCFTRTLASDPKEAASLYPNFEKNYGYNRFVSKSGLFKYFQGFQEKYFDLKDASNLETILYEEVAKCFGFIDASKKQSQMEFRTLGAPSKGEFIRREQLIDCFHIDFILCKYDDKDKGVVYAIGSGKKKELLFYAIDVDGKVFHHLLKISKNGVCTDHLNGTSFIKKSHINGVPMNFYVPEIGKEFRDVKFIYLNISQTKWEEICNEASNGVHGEENIRIKKNELIKKFIKEITSQDKQGHALCHCEKARLVEIKEAAAKAEARFAEEEKRKREEEIRRAEEEAQRKRDEEAHQRRIEEEARITRELALAEERRREADRLAEEARRAEEDRAEAARLAEEARRQQAAALLSKKGLNPFARAYVFNPSMSYTGVGNVTVAAGPVLMSPAALAAVGKGEVAPLRPAAVRVEPVGAGAGAGGR